MLKIIADENMPWVEYYFGKNHQLILKPGRKICRDDLFDADLLLVRSVTKINESLLYNTSVKFVGSATAGIDHVDVDWLEKNNIAWAYAPGCNARAVAEYVVSVVAALQKQGKLLQSNKRAVVIGVGEVGKRVVNLLTLLGFDVLLCDPVRAEKETDFSHTPFEKITDVDLICLHTPLTLNGRYPTFRLIDKHFLDRQKKNTIILNAGRGEVIDFSVAKLHCSRLAFCLDVWEGEPMIDSVMLEAAWIATPHIAGYSFEAKCRGTQMIYEAAVKNNIISETHLANLASSKKEITLAKKNQIDWRDVVLSIYDPRETTQNMRKIILSNASSFDELRKNFVERHEFSEYCILLHELAPKDKEILDKLGITFSYV